MPVFQKLVTIVYINPASKNSQNLCGQQLNAPTLIFGGKFLSIYKVYTHTYIKHERPGGDIYKYNLYMGCYCSIIHIFENIINNN